MVIIESDGFILRPLSLVDVQGYWECMQDEETKKGFRSVPENIEEAKKEVEDYIKKSSDGLTEVFTIEVDGKFAGNVRLDRQNWDKDTDEGRFHMWLHQDFRGKGLATKAARELIKYGFEQKGLRIIYAQCKKANNAICRVNEKVGFKRVEDRLVDGVQKVWWEIKR